MRGTGTYPTSITSGESVQAFGPHALPPAGPALVPESVVDTNRAAELALARLSVVAGSFAV